MTVWRVYKNCHLQEIFLYAIRSCTWNMTAVLKVYNENLSILKFEHSCVLHFLRHGFAHT